MTTTHKSLRGPRGAMLMVTEKGIQKDPDLPEKINKAVFPGLQGGPHDNQTAAIAVALKEAMSPEFKKYAHQIVKNAKVLADVLLANGFRLTTGGTENHLIVIDTMSKGVNGALASYALELGGIITNKNTIPYDTLPPFYPSGVRIGTPGSATRGMKEKEMKILGQWIADIIKECEGNVLPEIKEERGPFFKNFKKEIAENKKIKKIALEVKRTLKEFPLP